MRRAIPIPQVSEAPVMGGLVISNNKKSRNLSEPGQAEKILTGVEGANTVSGFESEILLDQGGLSSDRKIGSATGDYIIR